MTAEKDEPTTKLHIVRCIVCLSIKRGKPFTRGGGKRTLKGWVCGRCLEARTKK